MDFLTKSYKIKPKTKMEHTGLDSKTYYTTIDLGEASALYAVHQTAFQGLMPTSKEGQWAFVFTRSPALEKSARAYWAHNLQIDAYELFYRIKDLKGLVYSRKQGIKVG